MLTIKIKRVIEGAKTAGGGIGIGIGGGLLGAINKGIIKTIPHKNKCIRIFSIFLDR